jgi:4-hydroxybenzoate polyprenyltransferase
MSGTLRPLLELVRPPALCTAPADALTGLVWVSTCATQLEIASAPWWFWVVIFMVSVCVYAAGMVTNDLFDLEVDTRERPQRPLPSGRVSVSAGWCFAFTLQAIALVLSSMIGDEVLWATSATICATYLYNMGAFKTAAFSPLLMGLCRVCNFWVGASVMWCIGDEKGSSITTILTSEGALSLGEPMMIAVALSLGTGAYVTLLTALSRYEVHGGRGARVVSLGMALATLGPLLWLSMGWLGLGALSAILVCGLLIKQLRPIWSASNPTPQQVRGGVMSGIRGVALLNVTLCLGLSGWVTAGVLVTLSLTAKSVARWFYGT